MIDRRMAASPVDGLIVYPEGMSGTLYSYSTVSTAKYMSCSQPQCSRCRRSPQHLENIIALEAGDAGVCIQPEDSSAGDISMHQGSA